jgi:hypothetical protein
MWQLVKGELNYFRDLFGRILSGIILAGGANFILPEIIETTINPSELILVFLSLLVPLNIVKVGIKERRNYFYSLLPLSKRQIGIGRLCVLMIYMVGLLIVFSLYNYIIYKWYPSLPAPLNFITIFSILSISLFFTAVYMVLEDIGAFLNFKWIDGIKLFYMIFGAIFYFILIISFFEKNRLDNKNVLQNAMGQFAEWLSISFWGAACCVISALILIVINTWIYEKRRSYLE